MEKLNFRFFLIPLFSGIAQTNRSYTARENREEETVVLCWDFSSKGERIQAPPA